MGPGIRHVRLSVSGCGVCHSTAGTTIAGAPTRSEADQCSGSHCVAAPQGMTTPERTTVKARNLGIRRARPSPPGTGSSHLTHSRTWSEQRPLCSFVLDWGQWERSGRTSAATHPQRTSCVLRSRQGLLFARNVPVDWLHRALPQTVFLLFYEPVFLVFPSPIPPDCFDHSMFDALSMLW